MGCSFSTSLSNTRALASGSSGVSDTTCSARCAPIASAFAQRRLRVGRRDGRDDDFVGATLLLDAQRLFDRDLGRRD